MTFDLIKSERDRSAGQVDSKSLPFIFVETSGLDQQVTDGCATDNPVAAQPATAKRDLRCQDEEAISVRCQMLSYDDGALSAVIAACL